MTIRPENVSDIPTIRGLIERAFRPMPFSDGSEPDIVDRLRARGELALSLVAERGGEVVGHVAFSAAGVAGAADRGWYALGPVAVEPSLQRRGIGGGLIEEGLRVIRERGARGVMLIGSAEYYARFGFSGDGRLRHGELPDELVQWLAFGAPPPRGEIRFAGAFHA